MDINFFIDANKERFVADLSRLVAVRSVRGEAGDGKPYGEGPARALAVATEIAREHGFALKNIGGHAGELDLGDQPSLLVLAHLDVVDEGDGWTRPPYTATREGDLLYGRGTTDDKGPALAALYALEAVRQSGTRLQTGARLVLGCAEETGSEDMDAYFAVRPQLPYCFSPDGSYPLIHLEKGRLAPFFGKDWKKEDALPRVCTIRGGKTPNIVPRCAEAEVLGLPLAALSEQARQTEKATGVHFSLTKTDNGVRISAEGVSAHAAEPHKGNNAQTALLALLAALPLAACESTAAVRALCRLFPHGDTSGAALGVQMQDTVSGALTLNFGVLTLADTGFTACFDSRTPLCATGETLLEPVCGQLRDAGFIFSQTPTLRPVHYVPKDAPFVKTLLNIYENFTGEKGEALAIGGGTYVHDIESGVAFGCEMPGRDYRIHGADEYADINELLLSAKMFAAAIVALCGEDCA